MISFNLENLQKIKQEQVNLLHEIVLQNERKESIAKLIRQIKPLKSEKKEILKMTGWSSQSHYIPHSTPFYIKICQ